MSQEFNITVLPGDGIGPEVIREAVKILKIVESKKNLKLNLTEAPVGGAGYEATGHPLPEDTLKAAASADAVLLGAVGGPKWETIDFSLRPERALLGLRSNLGLFANLRPALVYKELAAASSLKPELVEDLDLMILRELTGDIYFGQPRGQRETGDGEREGFDTMKYSESEIRRIAHVAFTIAGKRNRKLCSVDKANVLDTSILWREVVTEVSKEYPDIELSHMYVDNAAMQLVRAPKQFDVLLTGNMFGDILSDEASMLTGSIGMLPSASLDAQNKGLYEPVHGSAPDIDGKNLANPLAMILSVAMMLRYTFGIEAAAQRIEKAVGSVLQQGLRTQDIYQQGNTKVGTSQMGDAVVAALGK